MTEYTIKLSRIEVLLFTAASAIILEYAYVAYTAMTHGGYVTNYFNNYHEGWFEVVLMLSIGLYVLIKMCRSDRVEAT